MRTKMIIALTLCVFGLGAWPASLPAQDLDVSFFYDELAPHGRWMRVERWGWAWSPSRVPIGWRPYTTGRWVWTDQGNAWVADEGWGWITFHYGRWFFDDDEGWLWVPGTVWAPCWVAWRYGAGYVGWAPLPPWFGFDIGFGFVSGFDFDDLDDHWWSFCPERELLAPHVNQVIIIRARNVTLRRLTRNITRIVVDKGRVLNRSMDEDSVARWTGRSVQRHKVGDLDRSLEPRRMEVRDDEVRFYRPSIVARPAPRSPRNAQLPTPGPGEAEKGRKAELEQYEKRKSEERSLLEQFQKRDSEQLPPGVRREDIPEFHRRERGEMDRQEKIEKRLLEQRFKGKRKYPETD